MNCTVCGLEKIGKYRHLCSRCYRLRWRGTINTPTSREVIGSRTCPVCGDRFDITPIASQKIYCGPSCRQQQEYYSNIEKIKARRVRWTIAHPNAGKEAYQKNKVSMNARSVMWSKTPKGRFARRRITHYKNGARRSADRPTYEWWVALLQKVRYVCPACHIRMDYDRFDMDMIVPISKGGELSKQNVQPLCKTCNRRKHTSVVRYIPA